VTPPLPVYILNWNGGATVHACVDAVLGSTGVQPVVRVIDNASTDGSAAALRGRLGRDAVYVQERNLGYAGGMNAALARMAAAGEEHAVLLTQDVRVEPAALARLTGVLDAEPRAAIAGPVTIQRALPPRLMTAGGRLDRRRLDALQIRSPLGAAPYAVDWVDGCCVIVRGSALAEVGAFDERYFLYFEETDLCCRLAAAGWKVMVAPDAFVHHEKSGVPPAHYFYYMSRNRYLFWSTNFGVRPARIAFALALDVLRTAGAIGRAALHRDAAARVPQPGLLLARQLRGAWRGSRDFLEGRLGPMP
jgi:GT2 family glycosyltransferase